MVEEYENQGVKVVEEYEFGYVVLREIDVNQFIEVLIEVDDGGILFLNVIFFMNSQDIEEIIVVDIIVS